MSTCVIYTNETITIISDNDSRSFAKGHEDFDNYVAMWKNRDLSNIDKLFHKEKTIIENNFSKFGFEVKNGVVYVNNKPVVTSLAKRIKEFAESGKNPERLIKFWKRLLKNPSMWCVQSLFDFLDKNKCPISDDGKFMAYKAVTVNFKDKYSGKIDNSPGIQVPPFERNEVDDDKTKDCSYGYHVGSIKYVEDFGSGSDRFIEVLVDPADAVSIPGDVNQNKIRVCSYKVIREVPKTKISYEKYNDEYDESDEEDDIYDDCGEYTYECAC